MAMLGNIVAMAVVVFANCVHSEGFSVPPECTNTAYCTSMPPEYESYSKDFDEMMEKVSQTIPSFEESMSTCGAEVNDQSMLAMDQNCPSQSETVKPFVVMTNETAKLVVQSGFYEQKFTITHCVRHNNGMAGDGSTCLGNVVPSDSSNYKASCKTIKGDIKLYVYDTKTKELQRESLSIDVCCSCAVTLKEDGRSFLDDSLEEE